jgi:transposase
MVKAQAKAWIVANEKFECSRLAEKQGHTVLFIPPYHNDLQPMEYVWALIKGNIDRQFSVNSTLEIVYRQLLKEFDNLLKSRHDFIHGMIEKCMKLA